MKILQNEITGTQTSFSTNFGGKLSFILFFLTYIFAAPTCRTTIITLETCALNAQFQYFIRRLNKISLLCGYHWERIGGETEGDFTDNSNIWIRPTLDEGPRSREDWIQEILLVESFKLVPMPLNEGARPKGDKLKLNLNGTCFGEKIKWSRWKNSSWFWFYKPRCILRYIPAQTLYITTNTSLDLLLVQELLNIE